MISCFRLYFLLHFFCTEFTHYYVMAADFLAQSFFVFYVEHLNCFVVVVACRDIDLYDL